MVTLKIDGQEVTVKPGATILEAAKSIGKHIPTLCYHQAIKSYGACRICTVEVVSNGRKRMVPACNFAVESGIEVVTDSPALRAGRKMILELLAAECPEVASVRKMAEEAGIKAPRFSLKKAKEETPSETFRGIPKKEECILCGLCVRICDEVVQASAIGFKGRGGAREVITPFEAPSEVCKACGACSFVCPTGAIKMEKELVERLIKMDTTQRPCRYMLMGIVPYKICPNEYRCHICEVDQEYEDIFGTHPTIGFRLKETD